MRGGEVNQKIARGRCDLTQLQVHGRGSAASERTHVEWGQLRVAHGEFDVFDWHDKFFGDCLTEGSADVLPDFNLAGIHSDSPVLADVQPRADLLRERVAVSGSVSGLLCLGLPENGNNNNACAEQFEKVAAVEIEMVGRCGGEFVALRFQHEVHVGSWVHERTPRACSVEAR